MVAFAFRRCFCARLADRSKSNISSLFLEVDLDTGRSLEKLLFHSARAPVPLLLKLPKDLGGGAALAFLALENVKRIRKIILR